jgi:hypothetical protein
MGETVLVGGDIAQGILERAKACIAQGHAPLVVLDLDGTLYNTAPRTLRILQEFAFARAVEFPRLIGQLDALTPTNLPHGVAESLALAGIENSQLIEEMEAFWWQRFFTNAYLSYDLPTPGAVKFIQELKTHGIVPIYLTGRDAPNMLVGTVETLQRDGFPVGTVDTRIILKGDFETPDEQFKDSVLDHLSCIGEVVGVFDNEPVLCNLFRAAFPDAVVACVELPHTPGAPALADNVPSIPNFLGLLK